MPTALKKPSLRWKSTAPSPKPPWASPSAARTNLSSRSRWTVSPQGVWPRCRASCDRMIKFWPSTARRCTVGLWTRLWICSNTPAWKCTSKWLATPATSIPRSPKWVKHSAAERQTRKFGAFMTRDIYVFFIVPQRSMWKIVVLKFYLINDRLSVESRCNTELEY